MGAFYIAEQDGRFHPLFRDENLGSYATSQLAADNLTAGQVLTSFGGLDTGRWRFRIACRNGLV